MSGKLDSRKIENRDYKYKVSKFIWTFEQTLDFPKTVLNNDLKIKWLKFGLD